MRIFKRLQIHVKRARAARQEQQQQPAPPPPVKISIKEKDPYVCTECRNRYECPHFFCPQCLGQIRSGSEKLYALLVPAVPEGRIHEIWQLIQALSGDKDRDFRKSLKKRSKLFDRSDLAVLNEWKDVLQAEQLEVVLEPVEEGKKRKVLARDNTIFSSPASLPRFLSPATDEHVRTVAKSISHAGVRMQWVEVVLLASRMIEHCYKRKPSDRVIFSDYLFQMDQRLLEAARDFPAYYRARPEEFGKVVESLKNRFQQMEADMQAVRQQVDAQL